MQAIKKVFFLVALLSSFTIFAAGEAKGHPCKSKESCLNDPNCLCWCSQICGWRKKTPEDSPIYLENDKYGKHCYCNQWDFDHYEDNCIKGKKIKEPSRK